MIRDIKLRESWALIGFKGAGQTMIVEEDHGTNVSQVAQGQEIDGWNCTVTRPTRRLEKVRAVIAAHSSHWPLFESM